MKLLARLSVFFSSMLFTIAAMAGTSLGGGGSRTLQFLKSTSFSTVTIYGMGGEAGSLETEIDLTSDINPVPQAEFNELNEMFLMGDKELDVLDEETGEVLRTFIIEKGKGQFTGTLVLVEKKLPKVVVEVTPPVIVK